MPIRIVKSNFRALALCRGDTGFSEINLFLSDEGPMLETFAIRIVNTPTLSYFDLYFIGMHTTPKNPY